MPERCRAYGALEVAEKTLHYLTASYQACLCHRQFERHRVCAEWKSTSVHTLTHMQKRGRACTLVSLSLTTLMAALYLASLNSSRSGSGAILLLFCTEDFPSFCILSRALLIITPTLNGYSYKSRQICFMCRCCCETQWFLLLAELDAV